LTTSSFSIPESIPEMVAAALGSPFRCCVCNKEHASLEQDEVYYCYLRSLEYRAGVYEYKYEFSKLARLLRKADNAEPVYPQFKIRNYQYVLAAPSIEVAQEYLRARIDEWMEHWRKVEEKTLDPNRELPPIKLVGKEITLELGQHCETMSLRDKTDLQMILKDEPTVHIARALMQDEGFRPLDIQWKKIGDPGILLVRMPSGTPALLSGKHALEVLPKGIRKVSEALAHLDGKEEP
jgi:hypothetical protein